jgi:hypothetical protein
MAIKPYLIEVIGIDLWHVVEFSRYGCAPIPGLTAVGRAQPSPSFSGQKEKPRRLSSTGQIADIFLGGETTQDRDPAKTLKNKGLSFFWEDSRLLGLLLQSDLVARSSGYSPRDARANPPTS